MRKTNRSENKTKIFFITGFLGAGKTTLLNNILGKLDENVNVGMIINEFGEINVDRTVVEYKEDTKIEDINNGSIFCSCLSGTFVKSILDYQDLAVEYLFVESSGLSKPSSVEEIVEIVEDKAENKFDYQGMFCVIDAGNFLTLIKSLSALQEQIIYSDYIIINKIDLVEEETIEKIESEIKEMNAGVPIIKTEYVRFSKDILRGDLLNKKDDAIDINENELNCDNGSSKDTPQVINLELEKAVKKGTEREELLQFLEGISDKTYRIKGFLTLKDKGLFRVDSVDEEIKLEKNPENAKNSEKGLVIFPKNVRMKEEIEKQWEVYIND